MCDESNIGVGLSDGPISWGKSGVVVEFSILEATWLMLVRASYTHSQIHLPHSENGRVDCSQSS